MKDFFMSEKQIQAMEKGKKYCLASLVKDTQQNRIKTMDQEKIVLKYFPQATFDIKINKNFNFCVQL